MSRSAKNYKCMARNNKLKTNEKISDAKLSVDSRTKKCIDWLIRNGNPKNNTDSQQTRQNIKPKSCGKKIAKQ